MGVDYSCLFPFMVTWRYQRFDKHRMVAPFLLFFMTKNCYDLDLFAKHIINSISNIEFDSHEFILCYLKNYPASYGELLIKYNDVQQVNAEIGIYLSNHAEELNIIKIETNWSSENIFKKITPCAKWKKA